MKIKTICTKSKIVFSKNRAKITKYLGIIPNNGARKLDRGLASIPCFVRIIVSELSYPQGLVNIAIISTILIRTPKQTNY